MPSKKAGKYVFSNYPEFQPNVHPKDIIHSGFGKTYFRDIYVKELHKDVKNAWKKIPLSWRRGLTKDDLARPWSEYDKSFNKFKVKVGATYQFWVSKKWINSRYDTHGWFQWYCNFFRGRRTPDDERQIKRWKGVGSERGRFFMSACRLIIKKANGDIALACKLLKDPKIYPRIRQTLWHWGVEITPILLRRYARNLDKYKKKK